MGWGVIELHCEGVLQYFCGVARGGRNTFAALRGVVAILLRGGLAIEYQGDLDCEGGSQYFCCVARGGRNTFAALREGLAMEWFLKFHK